jgi:hypothetical protein
MVGGALLAYLGSRFQIPNGWHRAALLRMRELYDGMAAVTARDPAPDDGARYGRFLPYAMVFGLIDGWPGPAEPTSRGVAQRDVVNEDFAQVVATAFGASGVWRPQQRSRVGQRLLGEPPPPWPARAAPPVRAAAPATTRLGWFLHRLQQLLQRGLLRQRNGPHR